MSTSNLGEGEGLISPSPTPSNESELLATIKALSDQVTALSAQVNATKAAAPQFKPMERKRSKDEQIRQALRDRASTDGGRTIPMDVQGRELSTSVLKLLEPEFHEEDYVRINPEARVHGSDRTWAEAAERAGLDLGSLVGVVTRTYWINEDLDWKYRVGIKGLSERPSTGLYQSELLPA